MHLTAADLKTTLLALLVLLVYFGATKLPYFPSSISIRVGSLLILLLGFAMCTVGNAAMTSPNWQNPSVIFGTVFGLLSMLVAIWGLITGSFLALTTLTILILIMYLVTTLKHVLSP